MKPFISMGLSLALAWILGGCSGASLAAGAASEVGTSAGTTGGPTADLAETGTSCSPTAVVDTCAAAGLVCDLISARCRKPDMGEPCRLQVGCGASPPNLSCVKADLNGTGVSICLVPCLGTDSAGCPYGSSCSSNYCRVQAPASCFPGGFCPLGEQLVGQCLADGMSSTCFAVGDLHKPYESCNPFALNSQADELCAAGFVCRATARWLGGFADGGFCFPLCSRGCRADEHCSQPSNAFYQICRPGISCTLDSDTCPPPESLCVPDDASSLSGGCLAIALDAGAPGASCELPQAVQDVYPCQEGACLQADGGSVCTPLCNRTAEGGPACSYGTCDALGVDGDAYDVVGACW